MPGLIQLDLVIAQSIITQCFKLHGIATTEYKIWTHKASNNTPSHMHYVGVICWYIYYFIQEWLSHIEATEEWGIGASYTQDVLIIWRTKPDIGNIKYIATLITPHICIYIYIHIYIQHARLIPKRSRLCQNGVGTPRADRLAETGPSSRMFEHIYNVLHSQYA